jgi:hypothetical protein
MALSFSHTLAGLAPEGIVSKRVDKALIDPVHARSHQHRRAAGASEFRIDEPEVVRLSSREHLLSKQ